MAGGNLRKELTLFDAVFVGIGAIIGGGIFAALGVAVGIAGPAAFIAIGIAGLAALLTAASFARLSSRISKNGGAYEFARQLISPFAGFLTGFLWLASNAVLGATVALALGEYLEGVLPGIPSPHIAAFACLCATALNFVSVKKSISLNNSLVWVKLLALLLFVAVAFMFFTPGNFSGMLSADPVAVLSAAALIFFAYGGFARITTIAEEVKDAKRTVPLSIMIAVVASIAIYALVAFASTGLEGYGEFAGSGAFLARAMASTDTGYAVFIVALGGIAATASVLLTSILGVSRVLFAMARNKDAPRMFSEINPESGIPQNAVLAAGIASALLSLTGNLALVAAISSFSMLAYYASANYAALKLRPKGLDRAISVAGLLSCVLLMLFLSMQAIAIGAIAVIAACAYYFARMRMGKEIAAHHSGR